MAASWGETLGVVKALEAQLNHLRNQVTALELPFTSPSPVFIHHHELESSLETAASNLHSLVRQFREG